MDVRRYLLHIFLFLVTVFTTMMAGAELATGKSFYYGSLPLPFEDILLGLSYSACFLGFLTVHEFGHYLTAQYHRVRCTLPYYIPVFIPFIPFNIGSFGAVIRIKQVPPSRGVYFNIGVAGPIAGFVVALGLLVAGFMTLPPMEQTVLSIHPEYAEQFKGIPSDAVMAASGFGIELGENLLMWILQHVLPYDHAQLPPRFEMMHYPLLFVGFLACFFTALNLLPIGQLDGGHVVYGLFGRKRAGIISRVTVCALLLLGGTGVMKLGVYEEAIHGSPAVYWFSEISEMAVCVFFYAYVFNRIFPTLGRIRALGFAGLLAGVQVLVNLSIGPFDSNLLWLIYAFMASRFIGVDHPLAYDESPLSPGQKAVGYLAIVIFVLCFAPAPLVIM